VLLYFFVLTVPALLGLAAWQSVQYQNLEKQTKVVEADQEQWVEANRRLIADFAALTSSEKVENIAVNELGMVKVEPENVLQIWIDNRVERR
jgi:cell division protein FtsL